MKKNVSLYFKEGSSDKEYHVQLEEADGGFIVNFQYGRVGNALQVGSKTPKPVTEAEADKIYTKLVKEKTAKGYAPKEGEKKNEYTGVDISKPKEVIILPQLLNPIEDAEAYIEDDSYLAQEKMDGERRIVLNILNDSMGLNKKGTEVPLPKTIAEYIKDNCVLDGEIIGTTLFVFDLLSLHGTDIKSRPCEERVKMLKEVDLGKANIKIVPTAYTTAEKKALYLKLMKEGKEGIVFKKKTASYTHGRPASGGNQLKYKFYATATFIVEGTTKGKRSVGLELVDGKERVFMGKVTIPPNHDIPNEGDLVEVRYLYANKGGAVYQPTYLGKRNDSDLTDATISQIKFKAETETA